MTTFYQLQAMLMQPLIAYRPGVFCKKILSPVICVDGTTLSVQASETHYCTPRDNYGPYTEVEVWCISKNDVVEFEYSEDEPSGYVDIKAVVAFIDRHGGLAL